MDIIAKLAGFNKWTELISASGPILEIGRLLILNRDAYLKKIGIVTNIVTGKAEYMPMREMHKDIIAVRASASMPLVSRNVKIGNKYYLDGGISDAIPLQKSIMDGNRKNVVRANAR